MSDFAGTWTEQTIEGHPADVYEPPEPCKEGFVVLFLHGVHVGRLIDNPVFCRSFDQHGLRVVSPITQRSWWTDKICPEFDEKVSAERFLLDAVVPWIESTWNAKPPQIGLLGTSMGGQGALRLAFKYPRLFPVTAGISPAIDFQTVYNEYETLPQMFSDPEAARQETATLYVRALDWPRNIFFCCDPADEKWHDSSERLRSKLRSLGVPHECRMEISSGGHGWSYYNRLAPEAIDFVVERLKQEENRFDDGS
ncbi:MAG: alpha/beta hydrolase-fold protein [Planctomycetales bacterium]